MMRPLTGAGHSPKAIIRSPNVHEYIEFVLHTHRTGRFSGKRFTGDRFTGNRFTGHVFTRSPLTGHLLLW